MSGRRRERADARAQVVRLPRADAAAPRAEPRFLPSTRSVLAGLLLLAGAAATYVAARETSVFAVRQLEVSGAPPALAERVREVLAPLRGTSLVAFDRDAAERRLATVPEIAAASFDRAFPHTLRVAVRLERSVAVLRQGAEAWLVSARARVLRRLVRRPYPRLPRIWVPRSVSVSGNATLAGDAAAAVRAVAPLRSLRFPATVLSVRTGEDELTLVTVGGPEVRLGSTGDLRLKLAIAKRLLPLARGAAYLDVSVPERSVASENSRPVG